MLFRASPTTLSTREPLRGRDALEVALAVEHRLDPAARLKRLEQVSQGVAEAAADEHVGVDRGGDAAQTCSSATSRASRSSRRPPSSSLPRRPSSTIASWRRNSARSSPTSSSSCSGPSCRSKPSRVMPPLARRQQHPLARPRSSPAAPRARGSPQAVPAPPRAAPERAGASRGESARRARPRSALRGRSGALHLAPGRHRGGPPAKHGTGETAGGGGPGPRAEAGRAVRPARRRRKTRPPHVAAAHRQSSRETTLRRARDGSSAARAGARSASRSSTAEPATAPDSSSARPRRSSQSGSRSRRNSTSSSPGERRGDPLGCGQGALERREPADRALARRAHRGRAGGRLEQAPGGERRGHVLDHRRCAELAGCLSHRWGAAREQD